MGGRHCRDRRKQDNTGVITAQRESAGLSGWLGDRAKVENCYNAGEIVLESPDASSTFARGNKTAFVNCYELDGKQVGGVTSTQLENGELCYLLNGRQSEDAVFFQTLGEDAHPVLDKTHKVVFFDGKEYVNEPVTDAIDSVKDTAGAEVESIWTLSGVRSQTLRKGVNVVRMTDGTVRKILVK